MKGRWASRTAVVEVLVAALLFATITTLIFWRYFEGTYLAGSDAMGPLYDLEMMKVDDSFFSTWRNVTSLGYLNYPYPTLTAFFYLTVGLLNIDVALLWKLLIIISFWGAGFLMFVCAYRISGSYLGGLVAGIVYALNQVFLSQVTEVHHYFILGYALFPLLFLMFYRAIDGTGRHTLLALPLVALIYGTISAPHTILITGVFLVIFTMAFTWFSRSSPRKLLWSRLGLGVTCALLVVLPMVLMKYAGGGTPSLDIHYSIEEARSYSSYTLYHSIVLASTEDTFILGTSGGVWASSFYLLPLGLAVALVIPAVAFLSSKVRAKRPMILALIAISVLFIFLAKGPNPPGGWLFSVAFSNLPLMDSIRVYSRFHLLTGFAYALMIAMVFANLGDVRTLLPRLHGRWHKVANRLLEPRALAVLIVVAMLLPSSAIFVADEPRSFDLPKEYAEPYLWLRDQEGNFRVLNLPYQQVYYTSGTSRAEGYPSTMTLDVGMYSPLISNKAYAYGVETADFWSFLGSTLDERRYGYKEVPQILGGVAGVRYIVSQVQTSPEERELFASLNGITPTAEFEGGGAIFENSLYKSRLHVLDRMCLLVGTRADLPTAMGLRLVNLTTDGVMLLDEIKDFAELERYLDQTDTIIFTDSSLLRLAAIMEWPDAVTVDLASLADGHTTQAEDTWIQSSAHYYSGVASGLTADTTGANRLDASVNVDETGGYDLLLSVVEGPKSGKVSVSIDREEVATLYPYSPYTNERWVRLTGLTLEEGRHSVEFASDGSGNCSLGKIVLVPHAEVEDRLSQLAELLGARSDQVTYMVSASSLLWSNGSFFPWTGPDGQGISSEAQLVATDFKDQARVVDENAYGGVAMTIDPRGRAFSPTLHGLGAGSTYSVELSVNNPGDNSTSCQIELWGGVNGTLSLFYVSSMIVPPGEGYLAHTVHFVLPEGMDRVQAQIRSGENGLRVDRLLLSPEQRVVPEMSMHMALGEDYILRVAGGNGSVAIDGTSSAQSTYSDGIYSYDVGHLAEGNHSIRVGDGMYALCLIPSEARKDLTAATLSYERISNVQYKVSVHSNGPAWVLLSESYSPLWRAEVDGVALEHAKVDSMVNAFYLPEGGNHTVVVHFQGQDAYCSIIISILTILVAATAAFAALFMYRTRPWLFRRRKR